LLAANTGCSFPEIIVGFILQPQHINTVVPMPKIPAGHAYISTSGLHDPPEYRLYLITGYGV
jgi:hypothetical protein